MKLGGGKALKSDWSYNTIEQLNLMFITTGYLVDAPALWAVCDKCSCGWDVIVTWCLFLCLFVFACGHICVFCGYRHWCVTEAVTRSKRD